MTIIQWNVLKTNVKQDTQTGHSEAGTLTALPPDTHWARQYREKQGRDGRKSQDSGLLGTARRAVWSGRHQGEPSAKRAPESGW